MSVATIQPVLATPGERATRTTLAHPTAPTRVRPRRPGPGVRPQGRPAAPLRGPSLAPAATARGHSCEGEPAVVASRSWRLTERGLALVLVTAAVILAAAIAVVGLTALRVTSDGYRASGGAAAVAAQP